MDNENERSNPWDDVDLGYSDATFESFAEDWDVDVESVENTLRKSAWLKSEATFEEVVEYELGDVIQEIDYDTVTDDGIYLVTTFESMPGDVVVAHGIDGMIDWMGVQRAIDEYTDYHITNERLVDTDDGTRLVLTLAPE